MRFERDDAKVGLLVLLTLALFASLAFHRTLRVLFNREAVHKVHLTRVADLAVGTEVQLLGLRVGQVNSIEMERRATPTGPADYHFTATLGLRPDIVLWRGTRGVVNTRIMGSSYLDLRLPPVEERRVELKPGEVMEGETNASLSTLVVDLTDLSRNLDQGVTELRQELKSRGLASVLEHPEVRGVFRDFRGSLGAFRTASEVTQQTLQHGDETLARLDRNLLSLEKSLQVLQGVMERREPELDAVFGQVDATLKQFRSLSDEFKAVLKDAGPEAAESFRALRRTLESTEELIELLKVKPNRVVFGTPSEAEREAARKKVEESRKAGGRAGPPK